MKIKSYKLGVVCTEPLLGTQPQREVATEFITVRFAERAKMADIVEGGKKMADLIKTGDTGLPEDEAATLAESLERGTTAFHKLDGKPIYYDYVIKGFMKESGGIQNGLNGVKALRSKIDNLLFVFPRQIPLILPPGGEMTFLERPLRAQTMQGPRVTVVRSEMLPVGTHFECQIMTIAPLENQVLTEELLRGLLDYGHFKGLGQWRNGSYGRFEYELTAE